jgi:tetratricopeptide (TPR) repeat protein
VKPPRRRVVWPDRRAQRVASTDGMATQSVSESQSGTDAASESDTDRVTVTVPDGDTKTATMTVTEVKPGDCVDACDKYGAWYESQVLEVDMAARKALLRFIKRHSHSSLSCWEEWIGLDSHRMAKQGSRCAVTVTASEAQGSLTVIHRNSHRDYQPRSSKPKRHLEAKGDRILLLQQPQHALAPQQAHPKPARPGGAAKEMQSSDPATSSDPTATADAAAAAATVTVADYKTADAKLIYVQGRNRAGLGHHIAAIRDYNYAIELGFKDHSTVYFHRGCCKAKLTDHTGALADYSKAIDLGFSDSATAYLHRGNSNAKLSDHKCAVADYSKAIDLGVSDAAIVYFHRGDSNAKLSDHQDAVADYSKAIDLGVSDAATVYFHRGNSNAKLSDHKCAVADYSKAIDLGVSDAATVYFHRGLSKANMSDHQDAVADYSKALAEISLRHSATVYFHRAVSNTHLNDCTGAIADCTDAIRHEGLDRSNRELAYANRGIAKALLGDHKGAIYDVTRSGMNTAAQVGRIGMSKINKHLQNKPCDAAAYHKRAFVKRIKGQVKSAIDDYDRAIQLDPDMTDAYVNRAHAISESKEYYMDAAQSLVQQCSQTNLISRVARLRKSLDVSAYPPTSVTDSEVITCIKALLSQDDFRNAQLSSLPSVARIHRLESLVAAYSSSRKKIIDYVNELLFDPNAEISDENLPIRAKLCREQSSHEKELLVAANVFMGSMMGNFELSDCKTVPFQLIISKLVALSASADRWFATIVQHAESQFGHLKLQLSIVDVDVDMDVGVDVNVNVNVNVNEIMR